MKFLFTYIISWNIFIPLFQNAVDIKRPLQISYLPVYSFIRFTIVCFYRRAADRTQISVVHMTVETVRRGSKGACPSVGGQRNRRTTRKRYGYRRWTGTNTSIDPENGGNRALLIVPRRVGAKRSDPNGVAPGSGDSSFRKCRVVPVSTVPGRIVRVRRKTMCATIESDPKRIFHRQTFPGSPLSVRQHSIISIPVIIGDDEISSYFTFFVSWTAVVRVVLQRNRFFRTFLYVNIELLWKYKNDDNNNECAIIKYTRHPYRPPHSISDSTCVRSVLVATCSRLVCERWEFVVFVRKCFWDVFQRINYDIRRQQTNRRIPRRAVDYSQYIFTPKILSGAVIDLRP